MQDDVKFWAAVSSWRRGEEEMGRLLPAMVELDTKDRERLLDAINKLATDGAVVNQIAQTWRNGLERMKS